MINANPINSPYACPAVNVLVGASGKRFTAPLQIIKEAFPLECDHHSWDYHVTLPHVDEDIGHTLIHYLHTGDYQTLAHHHPCEVPECTTEYNRSLLAYRAALHYDLEGLAKHAKNQIQRLDKDISLFNIISLVRRVFPAVSGDSWLSEYLSTQILAGFEMDEELFQKEEFFTGYGEAIDFDKFLGRVMAEAYAQKLNSIRNTENLRRLDSKSAKARNDVRDCSVNDTSGLTHRSINNITGSSKNYLDTDLQLGCGRESGHEMPPSEAFDACLEWDDTAHNEVRSSRISLLTPSTSTSDTPDENFAGGLLKSATHHHSSPEFGIFCPSWQQHFAQEVLWTHCPRCKHHISNMFVRLVSGCY